MLCVIKCFGCVLNGIEEFFLWCHPKIRANDLVGV